MHTAAQPSHDWAASDPHTDFTVNANGTLNLLEATRELTPEATFVFTSTNKVYGDTPNRLPLVEHGDALELPDGPRVLRRHRHVDVDRRSLHSLFGVSKAAADLMVQEYGRYFGMPTVCFRGGCLTGPDTPGAQLHGFLAYLMRAPSPATPYTVFGYGGKQVRDNIHATDLVTAFEDFHRAPRAGAVYNLGGGRASTARCARRSPSARRSPAASWTGRCPTRRAWATTAGGSATSSLPGATTPSWEHATTSSARCARSTTPTSSAGQRAA